MSLFSLVLNHLTDVLLVRLAVRGTVTAHPLFLFFFFFNDTATTEIYTLSLHDALPIYPLGPGPAFQPEFPAAVRRGWAADVRAVFRRRPGAAAGQLAAALRRRSDDGRSLLGAGRARDGAVLHARRRRGVVHTRGLGQLVDG